MRKAAIRPDVQAVLDLVSARPLARLGDISVAEARALSTQTRNAAAEVSLDVRDSSFVHSGREIGLRCYTPKGVEGSTPVLVYFHGGGFVLGDLDSHHALCVTIAKGMSLPVVSVDYRLAPEHPWPAAPDDAEAAARWISANAAELLDVELTGLILAGDSAGANLAAVTARALTDTPTAVPLIGQFLMYPCVTLDPTTRSMQENGEGYFLTRKAIDWFMRHYAAPPEDPRFNLLAFDQAGMPPTLLVTTDLDPLRDEGRAYAARLIRAGVPLMFQEVTGSIHGCFSLAAVIPSMEKDVSKALAALRLLMS